MFLDSFHIISAMVKDVMSTVRGGTRPRQSYAQVTSSRPGPQNAARAAQEAADAELQRARTKSLSLASDLETYKQEIDDLRKANERLLVSESRLSSTLANIRAAKKTVDARYEALLKTSETSKQEFATFKDRAREGFEEQGKKLNNMQGELNAALKEAEEAKRELRHLRTVNADMQSLLDTRTGETCVGGDASDMAS